MERERSVLSWFGMNNDVNEIIMGVYNGYFFTRNLPESSDYTESEQNIEK